MSIHQQIMEQFPMRRTPKEKEAFRQWAASFVEERGWKCVIEETSWGKHKNVIIGDPDSAALIVSAHYDTGYDQVLPTLLVARSWPLWILWQAGVLLLLMLISLGADMLCGALGLTPQLRSIAFVGTFLLLLVLMMLTFPNRHNANSSTSGVAAVLQLCDTLPEEQRGKVAFILFDNAEKGFKGSKLWAKDHAELAWMRPILHLDAIGVGDTMMVSCMDMARRATGYGTLKRVLTETPGLRCELHDSKTMLLRTDHKSFKCGMGCACFTKKKLLGCVTTRLHTHRDTRCDQKNLDWLCAAVTTYLTEINA